MFWCGVPKWISWRFEHGVLAHVPYFCGSWFRIRRHWAQHIMHFLSMELLAHVPFPPLGCPSAGTPFFFSEKSTGDRCTMSTGLWNASFYYKTSALWSRRFRSALLTKITSWKGLADADLTPSWLVFHVTSRFRHCGSLKTPPRCCKGRQIFKKNVRCEFDLPAKTKKLIRTYKIKSTALDFSLTAL